MPKQCKTITFLAEHEAAHIRYSNRLDNNEIVKTIHLRFTRSTFSNKNVRKISEFIADSVAWHRISPNSTPQKMLEAVELLKKEGIS